MRAPVTVPDGDAVAGLERSGMRAGGLLALVVCDAGVALHPGTPGAATVLAPGDPAAVVGAVERVLAPRWVWWSAASTAGPLVAAGVHLATVWDLAAVHRLLHGGTAEDPATVWAAAHGLPEAGMPRTGQLDLLGPTPPAVAVGGRPGGADEAVGDDGYLRPEWCARGWRTPDGPGGRAARWAALAAAVQLAQDAELARTAAGRAQVAWTARSESAAALLAVELSHEGLPVDRGAAERIVAGYVGPRPADPQEEAAARTARDDVVRRLVDGSESVDLRNPAQVRTLLGRVGIDVPDTRSWRLEGYRGAHPVVEALLAWRKAERIATTYGYGWLDRHVSGGRLRGAWGASDGGAGRMTAQAGLHNLPAELREAVAAEPGHRFVRADLGQVEPRVLAAVSGDRALAAACRSDDLYAPVAERLGCDRPTAKVAFLAAMYGQTSGTAGAALRGLEQAYPVALRYLRSAEASGRAGHAVRTHGGRFVRMWGGDGAESPAAVAARGRFARNAVVQGAAAELFKAWAVTVRARLHERERAGRGRARIVLCLHDELLVHAPEQEAGEVADLVVDALDATARWWCPAGHPVRFVADVATVVRWSQAKA